MILDKRKCREALVLLPGLCASIAFSASQPAIGLFNSSLTPFDTKEYRALATLSLGPDFIQGGKSQTLTLLPPFQNHYTSTNHTATVFDGGLFLGVERVLTPRFSGQLGIAGYGDTAFWPEGHVWQFALPRFDNLSYTYRVQSSRVMLAGKVLSSLPQHQALHPYVSLELGAAFNRASAYQETSLVPGVLPMSPFANHSQTSFAYGVGIGADYVLTSHVRVGLGYQFANLGSTSLGLTSSETTTETLTLSHLYTNQLRFQLTYLV